MDGNIAIVIGVALLALLIVGVLAGVVLSRRGGVLGRLGQLAEGQAAAQNQISERLQAQERALAKLLEERLTDVSKRVAEGLDKTTTRTQQTMTDIQKRLAVIDAAQKNIGELSAQMVSLQDILANKQARGAFGEIQLRDLVQNALPPSAYEFQAQIGDGKRVDCLLKLPNPPGPIAIDAKFPLESYHQLRQGGDESARARAGKAFADAIGKHVRDIAEKYIVPGETAESALMFLPSEAVYAELHANFPGTVEKSYRARVWIVSPTTMMATLNTVRAVLKDARMREQADVIQREVQIMMGDVGRLDKRVANLRQHFDLASRDVGDIQTSAQKITRRGQRIEEIEVGEGGPETGPVEELETPKPRVISAGGE